MLRSLLRSQLSAMAKQTKAALETDTVRRIPCYRLPAYRPGKRNLYLREQVIRYVKSCRVQP